MEKQFLVFLFSILISLPSFGQQVKLTPNAEISLLTCGPGNELYSVFGHSAIRVKDEKAGLDAVFNYGTFTFSDDFYMKFTMGKLNYKLSVSSFNGFIRSYILENRTVIEQVLALSYEEKSELFAMLLENHKPENKYYLYDFFYNNCSTKIRDILKQQFGDDLQFDKSSKDPAPSFRQMLDGYLNHMDWSDFGIDLALGLPCDQVPGYWDYMFLPDELMVAFDGAKLNQNETVKPLVSETKMLFEAAPTYPRFPLFLRPIFLMWLLFIIVSGLSIYEWKKKKYLKLFDKSFFVLIGLFGSFLAFLWFFTDHTATLNNLNVIWANPLLMILGFFPFIRKKNTLAYFGFLAYSLICIILLISWFGLPQMLHFAVFPLVLTLALRSSLFVLRSNNP